MAGAGEFVGLCAIVDEGADGGGAVRRRDARRRALEIIDRDREGGFVRFRVIGHHQRDIECIETLAFHGNANEPAGVVHHEGDCFRGDGIGRDHDIAFVFPVLVVDDDDHLAAGNG